MKVNKCININSKKHSIRIKNFSDFVVFIFLIGLNRELRNRGFFLKKREPNLMKFLDLVALGTVCDVVPLKGLNRAFVKQGLSIMQKRENLGLKALSDVSKLNSKPNTQALGFSLGPRINAGGRIGNSQLGVNLLKETNENKAIEIAHKLDNLNKKRKFLTSESGFFITKVNYKVIFIVNN